MEKYESKQHQIRRSAEQIYSIVSDFRNFTPMMEGQVEGWSADENHCSFKAKGLTARLSIVDKEPCKVVKIQGDEGTPLEFTFWFQMKEVAPYDTRIRLVLHAKLNLMMKMMIGGKMQKMLDEMAEKIASALN